MNDKQKVTLLRNSRNNIVAALQANGFDVTASTRASLFPKYIKWSNGLLDLCLAANRISDGLKFYFSVEDWESLTAAQKLLFKLRGIRVRAKCLSFVIAPGSQPQRTWSGANTNITAVQTRAGLYAPQNFVSFTDTIYDTMVGAGSTALAAEYCKTFKVFSVEGGDEIDDDTEWRLPDVARLKVIFENYPAINEILNTYWGSSNVIQKASHWACQQFDQSNAYYLTFNTGQVYYTGKTGSARILPISNT
jgi:hypothetical protein